MLRPAGRAPLRRDERQPRVDGQVVRTATGANSETLDWHIWNVKEFAGQQAHIRVVDNNRFGWGHVLADEFMLAPQPARPALEAYDWLD